MQSLALKIFTRSPPIDPEPLERYYLECLDEGRAYQACTASGQVSDRDNQGGPRDVTKQSRDSVGTGWGDFPTTFFTGSVSTGSVSTGSGFIIVRAMSGLDGNGNRLCHGGDRRPESREVPR